MPASTWKTVSPCTQHAGCVLVALSRGKFAHVDEADAAIVAGRRWSAHREGYTDYAVAWNDGRIMRMHNLITGWEYVDHENRNGLDNRRENMRRSTVSQNHGNRCRPKNNTSGFKGVSFDKARGSWAAYINKSSRKKAHLGRFNSAEQAARSYDKAARAAFGEFARVNFPAPGEAGARG